jgi:hypothetical protein
MKSITEVPLDELTGCVVKLYLTSQDVEKLRSKKLSIENYVGDKDYLVTNITYILLSNILEGIDNK